MLRFSRIAAMVFGFGLPLVETARRWRSPWVDPPALADDYVAGALLLAGAWATRRQSRSGIAMLAAAWGVLCGMAYYSIAGQWALVRTGGDDPAPIPAGAVLAVKAIGAAVAVLALGATLAAARGPAASGPATGPIRPSP